MDGLREMSKSKSENMAELISKGGREKVREFEYLISNICKVR